MIRLTCADCGMKLAAKDELAGKMISCPDCKKKVQLPGSVSPDAVSTRSAKTSGATRSDALETRESPPQRRRSPEQDDWERDDRAEDDEDSQPRRRRKRKPVQARGGSKYFVLSPFLIFLLVMCGLSMVVIAVRLTVPASFKALYFGSLAMAIIGHFWVVSVAFRDGLLLGFGCLLVPVVSLYYLATRFDDVKEGFVVNSVGGLLALFCALVYVEERSPAGPGRPDPFAVGPKEVSPRPIEPPRPVPIPVRPAPPVVPEVPVVKIRRPDPVDPAKVSPALLAHWAFDEGDGAVAKDSGPSRMEAALSGCVWGPGVRGKAVELGGATDYIRLSSGPALNFSDRAPFTVAAWVKTASPKGVILSMRPMQEKPYDTLNVLVRSGKITVQIRQQGGFGKYSEARTDISIADNAWHHFAVVRASDGETRLYQDGALLGKAIDSLKGPQAGKIVTNNRVIGAEALILTGSRGLFLEKSHYQGAIDDLCFFGAALGEAEILQLSKRE